jgi:hypothetical protein
VRRGSGLYGDVLYTIDGKLPVALLIYIVE